MELQVQQARTHWIAASGVAREVSNASQPRTGDMIRFALPIPEAPVRY